MLLDRRVLAPHTTRATLNKQQELSSSFASRPSFRELASREQAIVSIEHAKLKAWTFGHVYVDKSFRDKKQQKDVGITWMLPECVSEDDLRSADLGGAHDTTHETTDLPSDVLTLVNSGPIETIFPNPLRFPTSRSSLYQNLLSMLSRPGGPVRLTDLVSYHSHLHSSAFRCTRTFNLLISHAIKLASFGTAERLLLQMKAERLNSDLETWKLRVRLMVKRGEWDHAWESVMSTLGMQRRVGIPRVYGEGMPLVIWLEFMATQHKGATPKWSTSRKPRISEFGEYNEEEEEEERLEWIQWKQKE